MQEHEANDNYKVYDLIVERDAIENDQIMNTFLSLLLPVIAKKKQKTTHYLFASVDISRSGMQISKSLSHVASLREARAFFSSSCPEGSRVLFK